MSPEQPIAESLRHALEPLAKKAAKRIRSARRGDSAGVHDARSALRRLRVGLELMGRTAFDPLTTSKFAGELQRIERALGPVRDDEVLIEDLDRWLENEGIGKANAAAPLRRRLIERRNAHAREVVRRLVRPKPRRGLKRLRRRLEGAHRGEGVVGRPKDQAKAPRWLVRHFVHDDVWRSSEEILAFEVRQPADFDVLHKVRGACRRLRFTLELLGRALSGTHQIIEPTRQLQRHLGRLHDDIMGSATLKRSVKTRRVPRNRAVETYLGPTRSLAGPASCRVRPRLACVERRVAAGRAVSGSERGTRDEPRAAARRACGVMSTGGPGWRRRQRMTDRQQGRRGTS